jgi:Asp-tRNA(Asn)/Glu-tRNA(Gln) amidotransferase A subunit family amidase
MTRGLKASFGTGLLKDYVPSTPLPRSRNRWGSRSLESGQAPSFRSRNTFPASGAGLSAITMPMGLSVEKLPIGFEIEAAPGGD